MNNVFEFLPPQMATSKSVYGYPYYPTSEDIYTGFENIENMDPTSKAKKDSIPGLEDDYAKFEYITDNEEDVILKQKGTGEKERTDQMNEKGFKDDMSGDDLDVPGSELDDADEMVGSEDEENNYYSIGGDDHDDLEEDHG